MSSRFITLCFIIFGYEIVLTNNASFNFSLSINYSHKSHIINLIKDMKTMTGQGQSSAPFHQEREQSWWEFKRWQRHTDERHLTLFTLCFGSLFDSSCFYYCIFFSTNDQRICQSTDHRSIPITSMKFYLIKANSIFNRIYNRCFSFSYLHCILILQ